MLFDINTDATVYLTKKLKELRKSALPIAIRGTLNDAAFHVKTVSMPKTAKSAFEHREKNFFKANSRYEKADGFDINRMKSSVGFTENSLKGTHNYSVKDLEEQEHGGTISHKSFIPTVFARTGKTNFGLVKPNSRLSKIRASRIINIKNSSGKNDKEKFVIAAAVAGKGGFVLKGDILFRIDTAPKSNLKSKKSNFKAVPIYTFKKGRKVRVKRTNFMQHAAVITHNLMDEFYIKQGQNQLKKVWK